MESQITADIIYSLFLKLKEQGLDDAEIKKALVQKVLKEQNLLQTLQKELLFVQKANKVRLKKRSIFYTFFSAFAIFLVLYPFLSEKVANIAFLTLAFVFTGFLIVKLRSLYL
ncbi:MAG: hypothetical protein ACTHJT_09470 [Cytophaga sp.]|uniref:hypothetical protein n=1 Tax=Cytophaga sp. TaxID=29535 RepID=UPI003F7E1715